MKILDIIKLPEHERIAAYERYERSIRNVVIDTRIVDTHDYAATMYTCDAIMSACMYDGIPCDRPSALAAAYSVPDGAPIALAAANLDIAIRPSDEACERHTMQRAANDKRRAAFRRGPAY